MTAPDERLNVAFVTDFPEERWESMDYIAEMLQLQFKENPHLGIDLVNVTPRYLRLFGRFSNANACWNIDRFINRRLVLPIGLWTRLNLVKSRFHASLVVDHSYAHIVPLLKRLGIPTLVICHDTDAISSILNENTSDHGRYRRLFAKAIYDGLKSADFITTVTDHVKMQLVDDYNFDHSRIDVVPNGIAPEFNSTPDLKDNLLRNRIRLHWPILVHVGSAIPRKRLDILINVVSSLKNTYPDIVCLRVGGAFTSEQEALIKDLEVEDSFQVMPRLSREELAAVYRQASVVLITSDAEGFGLPLVEALACGAPVVASDLPVLREVGGDFCHYAVPGVAFSFQAKAVKIIESASDTRISFPKLQQTDKTRHLQKYQWSSCAEKLAAILHKIRKQ